MSSKANSTTDLFGQPSLSGLQYRDNFLSRSEETALIERIKAQDLAPFRFQGWLGKRLTATFGWSYDFDSGAFGRTNPIPDDFLPYRQRAAAFAGLAEDVLEQALLIQYDLGASIGWHRDRPYYEHVIGVSLGAPAPMRFRKRLEKGFQRVTVQLAPRSIYLLSGEARTDWEHSIAALDAPRWSITFRSLSRKGKEKAASGQAA